MPGGLLRVRKSGHGRVLASAMRREMDERLGGQAEMADRDGMIRRVRRATLAGMLLNVLLALAKVAGGLAFNSHALVADAIHSFSDLVTDFAVIFGVRYWSAPPDEEHPYGHGKIETMVTAFIGLALGALAFELVHDAVHLISTGGAKEIPGAFAFVIAVLSVVTKEGLFRWTRTEARRLNSPGLEANAWHHRGDAFSSVPAAAAIALARLFPSVGYIDPLGAIFVSVMIFYSAWKIMRPALLELSEGGGADHAEQIREKALAVAGVKSVHAVRARHIGASIQADLHVRVDGSLPVARGHAIAHEVKDAVLGSVPGVVDVIVHIEPA